MKSQLAALITAEYKLGAGEIGHAVRIVVSSRHHHLPFLHFLVNLALIRRHPDSR
jgi:hypothetical protein